MAFQNSLDLALERAEHLQVNPQLTVCEVYQAELLRRLQKKIRGGVVWKGGTVLRLEGSERFSRDLEATRRSPALTTQRLLRTLREAGENLPHLDGLEIKAQTQSITAAYRIGFPALRQPLRITIEISLREKILLAPRPLSTARIVHPVGLDPVVVAGLAPEELMAEKLRALVMRRAGRDVYDVYWLMQRGIEFQPELFLSKMQYYTAVGKPADAVAAVQQTIKELRTHTAAGARTELANLFSAARRSMDFGTIAEDVVRALESWLPLIAAAAPLKRRAPKKRH